MNELIYERKLSTSLKQLWKLYQTISPSSTHPNDSLTSIHMGKKNNKWKITKHEPELPWNQQQGLILHTRFKKSTTLAS